MNKLNHSRTLARLLYAAAMLVVIAESALAAVRYVDLNSANPTVPYTSWAMAATNIQDAVDAAVAGDEIVVTNGIYATGGRATVADSTTNRVVVDKPLSLRSVNGPQSTTIDGGQSVRCVYLTNGASLSGFTLTNGHVLSAAAAAGGGGVFCESTNSVVSNCVVSGNVTTSPGRAIPIIARAGGAYGGTLNNCILSGNNAFGIGFYGDFDGEGGGACNAILNNCTLTRNFAVGGGGASSCTLNNCHLIGNSVGAQGQFGDEYGSGGGAVGSTLNNCALTGNSAIFGGGAVECTLNNCTLTGNSATDGGGASYSTLNNCFLTGNSP
ncbi:MAG TPA: hypothetical protein VEO53_10370, partial [Candidatus Binatia bacterium]|nr:hypothetical protein [Candidatus Binatia bacterium]